MGDRVSIQFKNGDDISVAIFSHWGGMGFVELAKQYVKELKREFMVENLESGRSIQISGPLGRLEPRTMAVDFIRWFSSELNLDRIWSNYYLGTDENDGDNSDNGNHIIDVNEIGVSNEQKD